MKADLFARHSSGGGRASTLTTLRPWWASDFLKPTTMKLARRILRSTPVLSKFVRENEQLKKRLKHRSVQLRDLRKAIHKKEKNVRKLFTKSTTEWTAAQRVLLLRELNKVNALSERDLHALLNSLFSEREMELLDAIISDDRLGFDLMREFYRLRLMIYRCESSASLDAIADLYTRTSHSFLRGRILNQLLVKSVKVGEVDQIEKILAALTDEQFNRIPRNTVMGISRHFIEKGRPAAAARIIGRYTGKLEYKLIYFLEPLIELEKLGLLRDEPHEFCNKLQLPYSLGALEHVRTTYKAVDDVDRQVFQHFIIDPLFKLLKGDQNLMEIRFSASQKRELLDRIKSSVAGEQPLSLIRLSDGESYAYQPPQVDGIRPMAFESDDRSFERHWWGAAPPLPVREDLIHRVRQAVARCNILGFPSVFRIIRDLPSPNHRYGNNRDQRALIRLLNALETIPLKDKLITEERCNQCALDAPFLMELSSMARSVVIVSCWPGMESKFPMSVENILVPPAQIVKNVVLANNMPPLFKVYPEILERVRVASGPGTLVFVGAGIIGKILVDQASQAGAVALDVGSLLDYMAGLKTRNVADRT